MQGKLLHKQCNQDYGLSSVELGSLCEFLSKSQLKSRNLVLGAPQEEFLWRLMECYELSCSSQFVVVSHIKISSNEIESIKNYLKNCEVNLDQIEIRTSVSKIACQEAQNSGETFDFILMEGNLGVIDVMEDLKWSSRLNAGGIMALYNFSPDSKGAWYAVNHFLKKNGHFEIIAQVEKLIVLKKVHLCPRQEISLFDLFQAQILALYFQLQELFTKKYFK